MRTQNCRQVLFSLFLVVSVGATAELPQAVADGISLNFGSDVVDSYPGGGATAVGALTAGVVPLGGWNDIPIAQQTNLVLQDSNGNNSGLTLSTAQTYAYNGTAYANGQLPTDFGGGGSRNMMNSLIYTRALPIDLTFTGTIPYSSYDMYIYYNAGVSTVITYSILDSGGNPTSVPSQKGGNGNPNSVFAISNGAGTNTNSNYVLFSGLTGSSIPTNFIIRASAPDFAYFNGVQIVNTAVPEPASYILCLAGVPALYWIRRRRAVRRARQD